VWLTVAMICANVQQYDLFLSLKKGRAQRDTQDSRNTHKTRWEVLKSTKCQLKDAVLIKESLKFTNL